MKQLICRTLPTFAVEIFRLPCDVCCSVTIPGVGGSATQPHNSPSRGQSESREPNTICSACLVMRVRPVLLASGMIAAVMVHRANQGLNTSESVGSANGHSFASLSVSHAAVRVTVLLAAPARPVAHPPHALLPFQWTRLKGLLMTHVSLVRDPARPHQTRRPAAVSSRCVLAAACGPGRHPGVTRITLTLFPTP